MAASGTITQSYDNNGNLAVTLTGMLTASTSPVFTLKGSMYTSYMVTGTFGAAGSLVWQGSNDNTNWQTIGLAFTVTGGGTVTPNQVFFSFYRLQISGGDGTTLLNASVVATMPR